MPHNLRSTELGWRQRSKHFSTAVSNIFSDPTVDAVYGDAAFFRLGESGKLWRRYRSDRFNPDRIAWGWMPAHTALFLHRRVYERFGVFRTDYEIAADFEFVARIFHAGTLKARYLLRVLVLMQMGGISTSGWKSTLRLNQEVIRACRGNGISTNWLKVLAKYPLKMLEFMKP